MPSLWQKAAYTHTLTLPVELLVSQPHIGPHTYLLERLGCDIAN